MKVVKKQNSPMFWTHLSSCATYFGGDPQMCPKHPPPGGWLPAELLNGHGQVRCVNFLRFHVPFGRKARTLSFTAVVLLRTASPICRSPGRTWICNIGHYQERLAWIELFALVSILRTFEKAWFRKRKKSNLVFERRD